MFEDVTKRPSISWNDITELYKINSKTHHFIPLTKQSVNVLLSGLGSRDLINIGDLKCTLLVCLIRSN